MMAEGRAALAPHDLAAGADAWFAGRVGEFARDLMALVAIPSVSEPYDPKSSQPFGKECARVIEAVLRLVESWGFEGSDHEGYAASVRFDGADAQTTAAFYSHLDVVAPGEGWSFAPFSPFVRDGMVFGRGANDNKGPALAVLYALRYLKECGYKPLICWKVYLGVNEEAAMEDVRYLVEREPHPQVSLVSDAAFPVDYGEKGVATGAFSIALGDKALMSFSAGSAQNAVAGSARAAIAHPDDEEPETLEFEGISSHAARPCGSVCAIALAARELAGARDLAPRTRAAFAFLDKAFSVYDGSALGLSAHDDEMGSLTCVGTTASYENGVLRASFNVRFPHTVSAQSLETALNDAAAQAGFSLEGFQASPAFLRDKSQPIIGKLTEIASEVKGKPLEPYTMGGGTYARWIEGAIGFGACDLPFSSPLGPGRGGAHEPDEVVELSMLREAFLIYVRAILAIDQHPELQRCG